MKPKPFVMQNPIGLGDPPNLRWAFFLYAPDDLLDYVANLDCIFRVDVSTQLFFIDPRYDYEEAWLFIYEQLETESQRVSLDTAVWGDIVSIGQPDEEE